MDLPVSPPLQPMLAKASKTVPDQPDSGDPAWSYEPKWDGFRTIVFRDGDEVVLGSRGGKDLARYFPEMVDAVREELPERCVVDGELVVALETDGSWRLDWDSLSERIHPADSRVRMLAEKTPAQFIGFDLLALGDEDLTGLPFAERRARLETILDTGRTEPRCHVTRVTADAALATDWFDRFEGAGLDGVVAKRLDGVYVPNKREMIKVKHARTADCVLIGYRIHKSGNGIGSMLLGLYNGHQLQMIGGASAFTDAKRLSYLEELEPLRLGDDIVSDGEQTRWRSGMDRTWIPVRPERVLEVAYDQMEKSRLRHAARFVRWRPDRDPLSCTYDQLDVPADYDVSDILERS
ncbi:ATP-dependent DNA ligase [Rhodococcus sp. BP-241]|uniref:ATP-dependent DNA ligase n=1 Tax=Rhodococcus sp. BP-241 TaxID=2739441 RepID=UPI001C9B0021|nr:ATP-dependent DNA ligase [Rhodococcus sp. BP-241]MBY6707295.1 ATP-dependent DNA ligase [Rhodococcus sp. BP-241]